MRPLSFYSILMPSEVWLGQQGLDIVIVVLTTEVQIMKASTLVVSVWRREDWSVVLLLNLIWYNVFESDVVYVQS